MDSLHPTAETVWREEDSECVTKDKGRWLVGGRLTGLEPQSWTYQCTLVCGRLGQQLSSAGL